MPRKGDGISKRKDGRFVGRYTVHTPEGPKRKVIYGRRYKEVEQKLAEARGDAARGIFYNDENLRVGEYLDRWLSDSHRAEVRESTYSRDAYLIERHAKPAIGRMKLKNLNAMHLQTLYRDRLDRGISENKGLSGSTVKKMHQVIHKALKQAKRWRLIPYNPAEDVAVPAAQTKEMRPLSADEAKLLLRVAHDSRDRLEALYILALHTGMRRGELLGLKWDDVDLDSLTIRVRRTQTRTGNGRSVSLGEPKTTASRRTVGITRTAAEALRRHRIAQLEEKLKAGELYEDSGLVFAGESGTLINPSNFRQRSLLPLLERAGFKDRGITFHSLRHTCASLLFQKNIHHKHVQFLLGHASSKITADTYSHMLPGMGREAADAMENILD